MMQNKYPWYKASAILCALLCIGFVCEPSKPDSPVIARVGKQVLSLNDLNKRIPAEYSEHISQKQRINYVKQWIDTELLFQEALRRKINKDPEIRKRLEQMKKDLLSAEMISRNASRIQRVEISEDSINAFYEQHKENFIREYDVIKFVEIIVPDMVTAWKVRNMITPTNFTDLATQYSIVPVQDPETVPFVPIKNLPPEISAATSGIRLNGTTSPIKLTDGVHIIRILDKQNAGGTLLVEEVRDEIISTLSAQSQKNNIENLLANLRQKSDYTFNFELITQDETNRTNDDSTETGTADLPETTP